MSTVKRKPRPSMPHWFWSCKMDGCWFCDSRVSRADCGGCRHLRSYAKEFGEKKEKGRHARIK